MFFKKDYRKWIERKTDKTIRSIEKAIVKRMEKGFVYYYKFDSSFLYDVYNLAHANIYYKYAYDAIVSHFEGLGYNISFENDGQTVEVLISWQSKVLEEKNNG